MEQEKKNVKSEPPLGTFVQKVLAFADEMAQMLFGITGSWNKGGDMVTNNFALGLAGLNNGQSSDAILRFRIVTWLAPDNAHGWYYLGCGYLMAGKTVSAQKAYAKALKLRPDYEEASYLMAIAGGKGKLPAFMPVSLTESHFDALAGVYDEEQRRLGYEGPALLAAAIRAAIQPGRLDHEILDIGVGTGLCGPAVRDMAATLTGVDLCGPMLAEAVKLQDATGKKIYDALIRRELHRFLEEIPAQSADIVMGACVVRYIGELSRLFHGVALVLKPGGLFAITADMLKNMAGEADGFMLDISVGHFEFSRAYLEWLAGQHGFQVVTIEEAAVYPEQSMWLCVFRK